MTDYIIPVLISSILLFGFFKGVAVFDCFAKGASEGMKTAVKIIPTIVGLLTAVSCFSASGILDVLIYHLSPLSESVGLPGEVIPLAVLRPVSGSGATAIFTELLKDNHPDGFIGRVASVLMGSSETTFYTIALYYGSIKVKNIRNTLVCSLSADFTAFLLSSVVVTFLLGR